MKSVYPSPIACKGTFTDDVFLFPELFVFALMAVLLAFAAVVDELAFVVRGGLCRCVGALVLVVFGRLLKNAPRTSSGS